jgi:hypothetical protein
MGAILRVLKIRILIKPANPEKNKLSDNEKTENPFYRRLS